MLTSSEGQVIQSLLIMHYESFKYFPLPAVQGKEELLRISMATD